MLPRRRSFAILCAALTTGCYEYVSTPLTTSLVGRRVQLSLTDSGTVALARQVGPSVEAVEGDLLADSAGAYVIGVAVIRARSGAESDWRGERVAVPHSLVSSFAERKFSTSRTSFAGALMTVGVVAITTALRGGGDSSGGIPSTGKVPGQ